GAGLGAATAGLPLGVRSVTSALVPKVAANPALTRLVGTGIGAAGGAGLGAVGGGMEGHPGSGAIGGAITGGFLGRHIGGDLASAAEGAMAARMGLPSGLEKAARAEAM